MPRPDPDDVFADSRMSIGDHIEELRRHLVRAILGLVFVLLGGLALDQVGQAIGQDNVGLGRPMLRVIVAPAETMVRDFYARRLTKSGPRVETALTDKPTPEQIAAVRKMVQEAGGSTLGLSREEKAILRASPQPMTLILPVQPLAAVFGPPKDPSVERIEVEALVYPVQVTFHTNRGETLLENKQYLTTLSVQEAFVVYFKVTLLCSVVVASPWIFFQMWSFVAAGLYPKERAYVYRFLFPSITLFLAGVLLCQFVVLPGAVKALIGFNDWLELDPDLRLNEWLGFALILPLVFGVSFQTPLVMFFLNRIGVFSAADYLAKWRYALMALAIFSAIITPTPDPWTMMYLLVPMFGLYLLGIAVCWFYPPAHESDEDAALAQVAA